MPFEYVGRYVGIDDNLTHLRGGAPRGLAPIGVNARDKSLGLIVRRRVHTPQEFLDRRWSRMHHDGLIVRFAQCLMLVVVHCGL